MGAAAYGALCVRVVFSLEVVLHVVRSLLRADLAQGGIEVSRGDGGERAAVDVEKEARVLVEAAKCVAECCDISVQARNNQWAPMRGGAPAAWDECRFPDVLGRRLHRFCEGGDLVERDAAGFRQHRVNVRRHDLCEERMTGDPLCYGAPRTGGMKRASMGTWRCRWRGTRTTWDPAPANL